MLHDDFERCLDLHSRIREIDENILILKSKTMSPKNQIISDMPRGGSCRNSIEDYISKIEKLEDRKKEARNTINTLWECSIIVELNRRRAKDETIELLYNRFVNGFTWNKCNEAMKTKYPMNNWNKNKCFRLYMDILHKKSSKYNDISVYIDY